MAIQKDKLIYDATTPADGDAVAAFLRTGSGALTSTNVSGKEGLDVNVINGIAVDIDYTTDSVTAHQGGTWEVEIAAAQTIGVTATDLDIRDLTSASDSVAAVQSGTWTVEATQGTSPWVVSATDLDIRDLSSASDSVSAVQSGTWEVEIAAGQSIAVTATDLDIRDLSDASDSVLAKDCAQALLTTVKSVSTSAALVAAALTGRRRILVQNLGSKAVYVGASGVTNTGAGKGIRVAAGSNMEIPLGAGAALHAVAESGTQECIVMELA